MLDDLRDNIRKVGFLSVGLLVMLLIYLSYIQLIQGEFLAGHPLNHRYLEAAARVERGQIFDRKGEVLAYSKGSSENSYERYYPYGPVTAHVVGYSSKRYGITGLEGAFNGYLSGAINPERRFGPIVNLWAEEFGANIKLTLDVSLQKIAYQALGNRRGAVIAIDPRTGAILAMVSKPSFEPGAIDSEWNEIANLPNGPLLNRATQGLYPPGSTIKIMVAEAALAEKIVDEKKEFNCEGSLKIGPDYKLNESGFKAHGKVNLEEALTVSCNVTFGQLALDLGRNRMAKTYERYGFNRSLGDELQEVPSRLPKFNNLSDGDLAQTGIGQASLLVTPLRMAMITAALANNGVIMKPYIVSQVIGNDGSIINEYAPEQFGSPVTPERAAALRRMMAKVVSEGTGYNANISDIRVGGKTGTAENPHGLPHSWFVGFAPVNNPEIVVVVIVENAGAGGEVAAPIARQIISAALR